MKHITLGAQSAEDKRFLAGWMNERIPIGTVPVEGTQFICHAQQRDDGKLDLIAVVAINNFSVGGCEAHIASDLTRRWATREFVNEVYSYVFNTAGKCRMTMISHPDHTAVNRMHTKLGHRQVGLLDHEYGYGIHGLVWYFTVDDWKASKWFAEGSPNSTTE